MASNPNTQEEVGEAERRAAALGGLLALLLSTNPRNIRRVKYYNGQFHVDGLPVPFKAIQEELLRIDGRLGREIEILIERLERGAITPEQWLEAMDKTINSAHLIMAALAGGSIAVAATESFVIERQKRDRKYLRKFHRELTRTPKRPQKEGKGEQLHGTVPRGRLRNRAKSYLRSVYITYSKMRHEVMTYLGYQLCRRVRRAEESCPGCIHYSKRWYTVQEMPPIGTLECMQFCRCYILYKKGPDSPDPAALWNPKRDNQGRILAKNGKVSNIQDLELHRMLRSKEFKRWFGDWENNPAAASKILDENGEPKIMYHGSTSNIEEFLESRMRPGDLDAPFNGFWFAGKPSAASPATQGPTVQYPVFLNIRNPITREGAFKIYQENRDIRPADLRNLLLKRGYDGVDWTPAPSIDEEELLRTGETTFKSGGGARRVLRRTPTGAFEEFDRLGDFVTDYYTLDEFYDTDEIVVAFKSNQIKSRYNRGTWSRRVNRILE